MSNPDWVDVEAFLKRRLESAKDELADVRASATETLEQRVCRIQGRIDLLRELLRAPETLAPTSG